MSASRTDSTPTPVLAHIYDWILPAGLLAAWLIMADVPPSSGGGVVQAVGMVAGVAALVLGIAYGATLPRESMRTLGLAALPVLALAVAALLATNPAVSFVGVWGARVAWTLWASALVWFVAGAFIRRSTGVSWLVIVIAVLGAGSSIAAFGDALGVVDGGRFWSDKPAGFFESSLSLAQMLVLGIGCALAWHATTSTRALQTLALVLIAVQLAGLALTQSRGAWLGMVVGLAAYAVLAPARALFAGWLRGVGYAVIAAFAAGLTYLMAASVVAFESPTVTQLDAILTGRLTLWRAALLAFAESPLFGRGPGQYSAVALWNLGPNETPVFQISDDPHSLLLSLLVGGGVVATGIAVAAAIILGKRAFARTRDSVPAAIIAATLIAWIATVLSTWVAALALLSAAALAGSLLEAEGPASAAARNGSPAAPPAPAGMRLGLIVGTVVVAGMVFVLFITPFNAEIDWERSRSLSPTARAEVAAELLGATSDPFYATWLIYHALDRAEKHIGAPDDIDAIIAATLDLSEERRGDTTWSAPFAERVVVLEVEGFTRELVTAEELDHAVAQARQADPASGFIDFLAAHELSRAGHPDRAAGYAREALTHPVAADVRPYVEAIAAGGGAAAP